MIYHVSANAPREGNGTKERPFRRISDADHFHIIRIVLDARPVGECDVTAGGNQLVQIGGTFNSLTGTLTPMLVGALIGSVTKDTAITDVNTVLYIAMGVFAATFVVLSLIPFVEPEQEKTNVSV